LKLGRFHQVVVDYSLSYMLQTTTVPQAVWTGPSMFLPTLVVFNKEQVRLVSVVMMLAILPIRSFLLQVIQVQVIK
jgi:hypothetical protein